MDSILIATKTEELELDLNFARNIVCNFQIGRLYTN